VRATPAAHRERLASAGVRGEFTVIIPADGEKPPARL
jgi:hypothetical protein